MSQYAIDMLSTTISPAAIKASGFMGVNRYLRNLSVTEIDGYLTHGLAVGTIFETAADRSLSGTNGGTYDGRTAYEQAVALGQPVGTLMWVNLADFAPAASQFPLIRDYYRAFRAMAAPYQVGGYATGWVINQMVQVGETGPWWQNAMNNNGWSGTTLVPQTDMYQDTVITTPIIAGTNPGDYDQNVVIGNMNWWTHEPPPMVVKETKMFLAQTTDSQYVVSDNFTSSGNVIGVSPSDIQSLATRLGNPIAMTVQALTKMNGNHWPPS